MSDGGGSVLAEGAIDAPLKALDDDEALVAYTEGDAGDAARAAAALLPGRRVVPVQLGLGPSMLTPAAAYQAVDLLLLGPAAATDVYPSQVAVLLAGGGTVALRWRRTKSPAATGPGGARGSGGRWVTRRWGRGRSWRCPPTTRRTAGSTGGRPACGRVVVVAALTGIALLAVSLWRWRYAAAAGTALALAATVAVTAWSGRQSPVLSAGGALVTWDGSIAQRDFWAYRPALRNADASIPWHPEPALAAPGAATSRAAASGATVTHPAAPTPAAAVLTVPVFASREHARHLGARLVCRSDGQPDRFTAHLLTDTTLAVLSRSVSPHRPTVRPVSRVTPVTPGGAPEPLDNGSAVTSPLAVLADPLYPGTLSGSVIEDEPPEAETGQWQTIFIDDAAK